jgi:hypothetical protein
LGRDAASSDTDDGSDWCAQGPTLGGQNEGCGGTLLTSGSKGLQALILSPEGDVTTILGTPLLLQGYAYNLEDGALGESALRWMDVKP